MSQAPLLHLPQAPWASLSFCTLASPVHPTLTLPAQLLQVLVSASPSGCHPDYESARHPCYRLPTFLIEVTSHNMKLTT